MVEDNRGKQNQTTCTIQVTRNVDHPYFINDPYSDTILYDQTENDPFFFATANDDDKVVSKSYSLLLYLFGYKTETYPSKISAN